MQIEESPCTVIKLYHFPLRAGDDVYVCHVIYIPGSKRVRRVMHIPLIFFFLLQLFVFTTGLIMIEFLCIYLL